MKTRIASGQVLRAAAFGCVPISNDDDTRACLNDLCERLTEVLHLTVHSHRAPSPQALANAFRAGRVNLAWTSPVLAASHPAFERAVPLARSVRDGETHYHAVLFARDDGAVRELTELHRARVAWVDDTSASGYVFPRLALARRGIQPRFASETVCGSHGAVVEAVREGRADLGATFARFEGGDPSGPLTLAGFAPQGEGASDWRVLLVSDPIPSDLLVAAPALLASLRVDPHAALERLHEREKAARAITHVLGADRFERCEPGSLDALRESFAEARSRAAAG